MQSLQEHLASTLPYTQLTDTYTLSAVTYYFEMPIGVYLTKIKGKKKV